MDEKTAKRLQKLLAVFDNDTITREEFVKAFEQVVSFVLKIQDKTDKSVTALENKYADTVKSLQQANDDDVKAIRKDIKDKFAGILSDISEQSRKIEKKLQSVKDGKDADEAKIVADVLAQIKLPEQKDIILDGPDEIRNKLELLQGDDRLDKTAIRGIEELEKKIDMPRVVGGVSPGVRGFRLLVGGDAKGQSNFVNFIAGTGVTLTYNKVGDRNDITINATGGGTLAVLTATGDVDDTNKTFTFASEPVLVVVNGATYRDGAGCTITGTSVELDNAPGVGGDCYGIG